ncbi:MAG: hypothetical protein AMJ84_01755 [Acidithiobacillales bacterium SM23_46]|jgi:hypothetical protein|nr:MAG: hypothetical protein AMJ84_01755 [Acidithiobacillales bacterium SM23_46]KPL26463.1 MAG: hypothetical protein AMJ72_12710 [Acidithiobacillales bacterium SM1_46]
MSISDVMIHINESLDTEARSSLEDATRKVEGVVSARFNHGKEHLLAVAYDTTKTNAAVVLQSVRAGGCTAQLVGM